MLTILPTTAPLSSAEDDLSLFVRSRACFEQVVCWAVLRLRALVINGDFDACWQFHLSREKERIRLARYTPDLLPWPRDAP